MNRIIIFTFILFLSLSLNGQARSHSLSEADIARLKVVKESLYEVEKKSLPQMIETLEKTNYPQLNLTLKEAMAHAYLDIVKEEHVVGLAKKEWLYSMVALNMAYFQFGGDKDSAGGAKNLNKLIRYKLKMYLPAETFKKPGFHTSIE